MSPRRLRILGLVAAFLALVVNPVLDAAGLLVLRPGLYLSIGAPLGFAVIAVTSGLWLRARGDSDNGNRIILSGIAAFVLGAIWGVTGVI